MTRCRTAALLAIALAVACGCERSLPTPATLDAPSSEPAADATALATSTEGDDASALGAKRRELTWTFDDGAFGATDVVLSIPAAADPSVRFPVLVALHGRGESLKGSRRGARGWIDDYELERAMVRLAKPPLRPADFQGFVSADRLRWINRALAEQAYAGLIVVCPFLPDVLRRENAFKESEPLAAFIVDVLLPRVYEKTPAIGTPASTGIDGVSLGGRASLLVGFARPKAFGAVGALQAAIDGSEIERFADLGARALVENPSLSLRVLSSDKDYFLRVNERFSDVLAERRVPHRYVRVQGTHGYRFNRGPGSLEMLLFHDRALRGRAWD